jgi:ATP-dependent helicase/nuclease subunit A
MKNQTAALMTSKQQALYHQRGATLPHVSAWVTASAGTGKTSVLTERVLNHLLAGTPPERLLCLTFTKAAAAEMSQRLSQRLGKWTTMAEADLEIELSELLPTPPDAKTLERARTLFATCLETPGGLKIQTIHGFCQSILRRFPLEADLPPHFRVLDDSAASELLQQAKRDTIIRAQQAADKGLSNALEQIVLYVPQEENFNSLLKEVLQKEYEIGESIVRHGGLAQTKNALCQLLNVEIGTQREDLEQKFITESPDAKTIVKIIAALGAGGKTDQERARELAAWAENKQKNIKSYCNIFLTKELGIRDRLFTKDALAAWPELETTMRTEADRIFQLQQKMNAFEITEATHSLLYFCGAIAARYKALKRQKGLVDYNDLIRATAELLDRPTMAPWVLYKLDGGIDHILIDEAQDTSPEQWAIIRALSDEFYAGHGRTELTKS